MSAQIDAKEAALSFPSESTQHRRSSTPAEGEALPPIASQAVMSLVGSPNTIGDILKVNETNHS